MTLVESPPAGPPPSATADPPPSLPPTPPPARRRRPVPMSSTRAVLSSAITILAVVLLVFVVYVGFLSGLHHARAQHDAYSDFRVELAQATAPVSSTQPGHDDRLLELGTPVALLNVPEIGLREVVLEGTTGQVLQDGAGHLRDTVLPGQAGISEILGRAATYGGPFAHLSELNPGDSFTVTTGQGVNNFRVRDVRRAGDAIPSALQSGKGRLVLVTADGSPYAPSGVLRVDADLISTTQDTPPQVVTRTQLLPSEAALATDPTALFALFLWGQALLLVVIAITCARLHWGRWQVWIIAVPAIGFFGLAVADQVTRLLPNLM